MTKGTVVVYFTQLSGPSVPLYVNERCVLSAVAKTIAQLKCYEFGGCYRHADQYSGHIFFVPENSMVREEALKLGIQTSNDFFGGVVPHPFVKTKAITHQLIDNSAQRPEGWSPEFAERVRNVVLPGFTAFSVRDAHIAATRILTSGPVRVKEPLFSRGRGQALVNSIGEWDSFVEKSLSDHLPAYGVVLEMNLRLVTTLNIGQIAVNGVTVTYYGTQRTAIDNEGRPGYGGSDIVCVRGGWEALDRLPMAAEIRLGVAQARLYDDAASEYSGFMASRRNYDVGQGIDGEGRRRSGVFEASWRVGGASTAELAALEAFLQDPDLQTIQASAVKEFGKGLEAPEGAAIHFHGDDPEAGPMIRYTVVTRTARQAANTRQHPKSRQRRLAGKVR
jgi:hypothetical protein